MDVSDLRRSAAFWGGLLGLEPEEPGGQYLSVGGHEGTTPLLLQQVPEDKSVKNRVHLDIVVGNLGAAVEQAVALGGSKLRDMEEGDFLFTVMGDPDGNEFCLVQG